MHFTKDKTKKKISIRKIPNPFRILMSAVRYGLLESIRKRPYLPDSLCLFVTYRCNYRCRICGIWKLDSEFKSEKELTIEEFDNIFSDSLFANIEFVNLNGGEPNLRTDLIDIVRLVIKKFPKLKIITMNTNGTPVEKMAENVIQMSRLCKENKINFSVSVSLHDINSNFDNISGIKNSYDKAMKSLKNLQELKKSSGFYLSINCVVTNLNLYNIPQIIKWGSDNKIPINFMLGEVRERFNNCEMKEEIEIKGENKTILIDFLRGISKDFKSFKHHTYRYKVLADMVEFHYQRKISCHYMMGGITLGSDGSLYYCPKSKSIGNCKENKAADLYYDTDNLLYRRNTLKNDYCLNCRPYTFIKKEFERDFFKFIKFYLSSRQKI